MIDPRMIVGMKDRGEGQADTGDKIIGLVRIDKELQRCLVLSLVDRPSAHARARTKLLVYSPPTPSKVYMV